MGLVKPPKECLVCLNSSETIFVQTEESQKIFNICCSYVKDAINIEFLINNINGNNNQLSFCKNCFHSSLHISQLAEQLSKLKQKINYLASCFSETIGKQRIEAKNNLPKIQIENEDNSKFDRTKDQTTSLDSSDTLLSHVHQSDGEKDSFLEASNELIGAQIAIDEINSEIIKTESDGIFLDYEDESCTDNIGSGYKQGEFETNYLATGNENEIDPLGDIELETTSRIVNNCNIDIESKPQIVTSNSMFDLVSSVTTPNIVLHRIQNDFSSTSGDCDTSNSPKACHGKLGINVNQSIPFENGPKNSSTMITTSKHNSSRIRKKEYIYNCTMCAKSFYTLSNLKRHESTHTGEKPYKCSRCESSFARSDKLKDHERTHSKIKRYKCTHCEMAFKQPISLKNHQRLHTKDPPLKCSYCELRFRSSIPLKRHQNKVHPNTKKQRN